MTTRKVTQRAMNAICVRLADGESLRAICGTEGLPSRSAVLRQLAVNAEWAQQYRAAKEIGLEAWADDIVAVATTPRLGKKTKTTGKGKTRTTETITGDMVERSRLEVDAKKWIMSKLAPKKYGDRLDLNHGVQASLAELVTNSFKPDANGE